MRPLRFRMPAAGTGRGESDADAEGIEEAEEGRSRRGGRVGW